MQNLPDRFRILQEGTPGKGPVLYWMSRDQRAYDNWALLFAQKLAQENNLALVVAFSLVPEFLQATRRQYGFMLKGLEETENHLKKLNIPFHMLSGSPADTLPEFIHEHNCSYLVADFDPLKIKRVWKRDVAKKIHIPFYEVDAHNIVPTLIVSDKTEYGAYTIRPKINRLLPEYLTDIPAPDVQKKRAPAAKNNWRDIYASLKVNESVPEVTWLKPGEDAAHRMLDQFLTGGLQKYNEERNNPVLDRQSNLSPYLHFGQISAQRVAFEVQRFAPPQLAAAFLEELIVRRELSDNFCYFNTKYDSFDGFHDWAKTTLNAHQKDKREYIYSLRQFEKAATHEDLWNAAQMQMVRTGKMHGYMRMYWAKKILEWSESPEEALKIAIKLNDKYQLDGRDPNGYVGCAWSIGGVHDRAWTERPVYGKIRYMNYNGCKRKFDTDAYIKKHLGQEPDLFSA
ncbi:MAG: hypothetical protein FMNOHCHN_02595 [Ignavibacteriaceae bacterium]|nr:hypothetical protein [Ignavibacteriaceae bacterium]